MNKFFQTLISKSGLPHSVLDLYSFGEALLEQKMRGSYTRDDE